MYATLFDFNGVIVDDEAIHLESFREVLAPLEVQVDDAAYQNKYLGFDDAGAFRAILEDAGREAPDELIRRLIDEKKPVYMRRAETDLRVFHGAVELIRERAERGPIGVVSGALAHEIAWCLESLGVRELFSFIVSAEMTTHGKPDPEGYEIAKGELAKHMRPLPPIVVIEDSLAGIRAAKAAGLRCVAVAHSYPREELALAGADVVVRSIADLTEPLLDGD